MTRATIAIAIVLAAGAFAQQNPTNGVCSTTSWEKTLDNFVSCNYFLPQSQSQHMRQWKFSCQAPYWGTYYTVDTGTVTGYGMCAMTIGGRQDCNPEWFGPDTMYGNYYHFGGGGVYSRMAMPILPPFGYMCVYTTRTYYNVQCGAKTCGSVAYDPFTCEDWCEYTAYGFIPADRCKHPTTGGCPPGYQPSQLSPRCCSQVYSYQRKSLGEDRNPALDLPSLLFGESGRKAQEPARATRERR